MFNRKKLKFDESNVSFLNDPKKILKSFDFGNWCYLELRLKFKIGEHEFERTVKGKTIEEVLIEGKKVYNNIYKASKIIKEELNKIK